MEPAQHAPQYQVRIGTPPDISLEAVGRALDPLPEEVYSVALMATRSKNLPPIGGDTGDPLFSTLLTLAFSAIVMQTVKDAYPELKNLAKRLYSIVKDADDVDDAMMIRIEGGILAHYVIPVDLADWAIEEALQSLPEHYRELQRQYDPFFFEYDPVSKQWVVRGPPPELRTTH